MKNIICGFIFVFFLLAGISYTQAQSGAIDLFPADKAHNVNPDTHLQIMFKTTPVPGHAGQIRIYNAADNKLVDMLDLSIPAGPTESTPSPSAVYTPVPYEYVPGHFTNANTKPGTPSGAAQPTTGNYQLTIIGGFTDGFHFYPVIIHGNTATIYPHNNLLEYGKTYYVQIDAGVFTLNDNSFSGITGKDKWSFTTKKNPPHADAEKIIVSADGTGDFNTVQGAMDFIPDNNPKPVTVYIKNGVYEEIVYLRNKSNVTLMGEDRDKVIVQYANNEVFNPHPINIKTNEMQGTFPQRRCAFAVDHSDKISLINMTIKTTASGQAEGLLVNGNEIIVSNVSIAGSGDALQSNGTAYYTNCRIEGDGDTILGRGAAFFSDCELLSYGPFMWIRNTAANHGNVFINCKFETKGEPETEIARAPNNKGKLYPDCEAVLINCSLKGISPIGWGPIGGDASNVHYWEYYSRNIKDGKPVDISKRLPASKQLTMEKDAEIISNYMKPSYVLGGWNPAMAPVILCQPQTLTAKIGETVTFEVKAAAIPYAGYQWMKNGKTIKDAVSAVLKIKNVSVNDAAVYSVVIENNIKSITSNRAVLKIQQ
jgi:pectinesterase